MITLTKDIEKFGWSENSKQLKVN